MIHTKRPLFRKAHRAEAGRALGEGQRCCQTLASLESLCSSRARLRCLFQRKTSRDGRTPTNF
eukprot:6192043-Pleurochrysis_carterae.AAC.1